MKFSRELAQLVRNNGGVVPTRIEEMLQTWLASGKFVRKNLDIEIKANFNEPAPLNKQKTFCPYVKKNKGEKGKMCGKPIRKSCNQYCSRHNAYMKSKMFNVL